MEKLSIIGFASGAAANDLGCTDGPRALQTFLAQYTKAMHWHEMLSVDANLPSKLMMVSTICRRLATLTQQFTQQKQRFAVIGGDHSSALGTWSGVRAALADQPLGLIWIDAHLDSHTLATTYTGNIHGMPLASLLGYGAPELTSIIQANPVLLPEHVCIIGARSYEAEELALLSKLQVKIFYMDDIKQQGISAILQQAIAHVSHQTAGFGVSIDLDAIDPLDAPGVGCPTPDGLAAQPLCQALQLLQHEPRLLGTEIVEFNPSHDQQQRTAHLIWQLLTSIYV